jgi:hypothetical protein
MMNRYFTAFACVYGFGAGLADLYFSYVWLFSGHGFWGFVQGLFTYAIYGWAVTAIQSLAWPLYAAGVIG